MDRSWIVVATLLAGCGTPAYAGCIHEDLLRPAPGEVTIAQLRLPGTWKHGEAGVIVGPDGTIVLLDVGNSNHSDAVRDVVRSLNTRCLRSDRGYSRDRAELEVDWIVITHLHGDHAGGLEELLTHEPPLLVTRGIIHRGLVDLGGGMNSGAYGALCRLTRGAFARVDTPLCHTEIDPACDPGALTQPHRASGCPGLFAGDLGDPDDDALSLPGHIPLGDGARLVFVAADAFVSDGERALAAPGFGHDANNEENARSLVGLVEHGAFRYHFGGDLSGAGTPGVPDVESVLAEVAGPRWYGELGMDVVHAHHHVRRTSSNAAFVELTTPNDGRSRNVVGGIAAHLGSPHGVVLARFGDDARLGEGRIWITRSTSTGDDHAALVLANAAVTVRTFDGGARYAIEASRPGGPVTLRFDSVRSF